LLFIGRGPRELARTLPRRYEFLFAMHFDSIRFLRPIFAASCVWHREMSAERVIYIHFGTRRRVARRTQESGATKKEKRGRAHVGRRTKASASDNFSVAMSLADADDDTLCRYSTHHAQLVKTDK
jgi:hypothetical protein